jgi:hypothetical protein
MANDYVRHVIVSPVCSNRDCPDREMNEMAGTFALIRFKHPNPIMNSIDHRSEVDVWFCTACGNTVKAAADPPVADHTKLMRSLLRDLDAVAEGTASINLNDVLNWRDHILGAIGGAEEIK